MKKKIFLTSLLVAICLGLPGIAVSADRKGSIRAGLYAPGLFFGSDNIGAMMSFGADGEYFVLENLAVNFRLEEATDFNAGGSPNSVFNFVGRARYVLDIGESGRWAAYLQAGGGGALIGSNHAAGDVAIPGGGLWYQWKNNWSVGLDSSLHILVRSNTAVAFDITPVVRYQF